MYTCIYNFMCVHHVGFKMHRLPTVSLTTVTLVGITLSCIVPLEFIGLPVFNGVV